MSVLAWILIAVLVVASVGGLVAVWWERRSPTSFTRGGDLAWWGLLPAKEQEVWDTAVLDVAEQAELDARLDAQEAAGARAEQEQARVNALFHP
jgi:hypothetical protein